MGRKRDGFYAKWTEVVQPAFIFMEGKSIAKRTSESSGGEIGKSSLDWTYATFDDVFVSVLDVQLEPMSNVKFLGKYYEELTGERHPMFSVTSTSEHPDAESQTLVGSYIEFENKNAQTGSDLWEKSRQMTGFVSNNMLVVQLSLSKFSYLHTGAFVEGVTGVISSLNTIEDCTYGIRLNGLASLFQCFDDVNNTGVGVEASGSGALRIANSDYTNNQNAVSLAGVPEATFRSVRFNDYVHAINNVQSNVYLRTRTIGSLPTIGQVTRIYGGLCDFNPESWDNSAYAKGLGFYRNDYFVSDTGSIEMTCGYNYFVSETQYRTNLFGNEGQQINYSIGVDYNKFDLDGSVHQVVHNSKVSDVGTPINVEQTDNKCLYDIHQNIVSLPLTCILNRHPNREPSGFQFRTIHESWFETTSGTIDILIDGYKDAMGIVLSSNSTVSDVREYVGQAAIAAELLSDSLPQYRDTLVYDLEQLQLSTSASVAEYTKYVLGYLYSKQGESTKAVVTLTSLATSSTVSEYATLANIRIDLVESAASSTNGHSYIQSLLAAQKQYDVFFNHYGVLVPNSKEARSVRTLRSSRLLQINPNPAFSSLNYTFVSSHAGEYEVSLHSVSGVGVVKEQLTLGKEETIDRSFDVESLIPGMYILRITGPSGFQLNESVVIGE